MNHGRLIFRLILIASFFALLFALHTSASANCVKFEHFDFFTGNAPLAEWSEKDLNKLVEPEMDWEKTSPLVPAVVRQLAQYEAGCGTLKADEKLELYIKLYSNIRREPSLLSTQLTTIKKFEMIREDFYRQLTDDELFPMLIYTMDDGPLSGELADDKLKPKVLSSQAYNTSFGKLTVSNTEKSVMITASDKRDRIMWSRFLRGENPERYLKNASLATLSIKQPEFVTSVKVDVDGEILTLYLRPNGKFLYYTHSW